MIKKQIDEFKYCDFFYKDEKLSHPIVMNIFWDYLKSHFNVKDKNIGFIFHPYSNLFDLILVIYAAMNCVLSGKMTPNQLISSLPIGSTVIHDSKRQMFKGIDKDGYAVLEATAQFNKHSSPITSRIRSDHFFEIIPYLGESKTLNGKGVHQITNLEYDFYKKIWGLNRLAVSAVFQKSLVVICEKEFADSFVKDFEIHYDSNNTVHVTDLFPVSYYPGTYSDNINEIRYPGNSSKLNPVIKFTSSVFRARNLIFNDSDITCLLLIGEKYVKKDTGEIEDLINRNSVISFYGSFTISSGIEKIANISIAKNNHIFACTKDMLLSMSPPQILQEKLNKQLEQQISDIITREIKPEIMNNTILNEKEYSELISALNSLRPYSNSTSILNDFIIVSFGLLNFITNIPFPLEDVESFLEKNNLSFHLPSENMGKLYDIINSNNDGINDIVNSKILNVYNLLKKAIDCILTKNPKYDFLISLLLKVPKNSKILILVAKPVYINLLRKLLPLQIRHNIFISYETISSFKGQERFDLIILLGELGNKIFSIFNVYSGPNIECLLYPYEYTRFQFHEKQYIRYEKILNTQNMVAGLQYEVEENQDVNTTIDKDASTFDDIDRFVNSALSNIVIQHAQTNNGNSSSKVDIARIATTNEGETILFTKRFRPYIYEDEERIFKICNIQDVHAGDTLLFTRNSETRRDIVDEILQTIIKRHPIMEEDYFKSKYWKECLLKYKENHALSYSDLSQIMEHSGINRDQMTLRSWLEQDSKIIGPRNKEVFISIAKVTGDISMLKNPESYYYACNEIRARRIRILRFIGRHIIAENGYNGEDKKTGNIHKKLKAISHVVYINEIHDVENIRVSSSWINRPILS
jgi:hypothetical protein